ncbi:hypothetical protein KM043_000913 [Ampulex compressa]|nr:hypothetical protein KM043_000913 [Ampulex compressa]
MSSLKGDKMPYARLCHILKWDDFDGYGFNLHADKGKDGQFIGKVDEGSPSQAAGLRQGDRIVEVNEINIANESHKQVVERIKAFPNETKLLVVDQEADDYFKANNVVIKGTMANVKVIKTPEKNPNSVEQEERSDGSNASVDESAQKSIGSNDTAHSDSTLVATTTMTTTTTTTTTTTVPTSTTTTTATTTSLEPTDGPTGTNENENENEKENVNEQDARENGIEPEDERKRAESSARGPQEVRSEEGIDRLQGQVRHRAEVITGIFLRRSLALSLRGRVRAFGGGARRAAYSRVVVREPGAGDRAEIVGGTAPGTGEPPSAYLRPGILESQVQVGCEGNRAAWREGAGKAGWMVPRAGAV